MPKLYTIPEAAEILRVSDRYVYDLCRSKALKAIRMGSKWLITEKAIEEYLTKLQEAI
jgi:excisionase family DNA binding protein